MAFIWKRDRPTQRRERRRRTARHATNLYFDLAVFAAALVTLALATFADF